jgi:uncharacterized membrane protein
MLRFLGFSYSFMGFGWPMRRHVLCAVSVSNVKGRRCDKIGGTEVPALCKENIGFRACSYPVRPYGSALG